MQIKCIKQAEALMAARSLSTYSRKQEKKRVFAEIRRLHPTVAREKFVMFVENPSNPLYATLRSKRSKLPLDDGRPEPVQLAAPVVKVTKPKVAKVAPGIKAIVKAVTKKAVVKAPVKAVVKAPVKAAVVKAPVKAAVVKAPVKAVAKAPVKAVAKAPVKKTPVKAVSKAPVKAVKKAAPTKVATKRK